MNNRQTESGPAIDVDSRLSLEDSFEFACGPEVRCFTECCGKLELLLTPYDVLRLHIRLGISSAEFLDTYSIMRWATGHGFPEIMMKMNADNDKRCPFVTPEGCSVYEDRPGACRIYPLGRAATKHAMDGTPREFYFPVREDHCKGFEQNRKLTVREWLADQGMEDYNRINDLLMELYILKARSRGIALGQQHMQMFTMACYNTERFRDFIFKSGFLQKFDLDEEVVADIKQNDVKLLEFAFQWLKFALFREPVLKIK
jgi:uncharacterized protein